MSGKHISSSSSSGVGFFALLTVMFVGLKLTGYIDWSWWWVTVPTWGPLALGLIICAVFLLLALLVWRNEQAVLLARKRGAK